MAKVTISSFMPRTPLRLRPHHGNQLFSAQRWHFPLSKFPVLRLWTKVRCIPGRTGAICWSIFCAQMQSQDSFEGDEYGGFDISVLEAYTEKVPSEVLVLHAVVDGEEDEVMVYKGMSSSLMKPTASDVSEPVLPASATIKWIDRIESPYNHVNCKFIQKNVSWDDFRKFLSQQFKF